MEITSQHPSVHETPLAQPDTSIVTPKRGDLVRIHAVDDGVASAKYAHVIGVSSLDDTRLGENGEPYLTVIYQHSTDQKLLGSPDWHHAFTRVGPVHHGSAASSQAGRESVYWTDLMPAAGEAVDIDEMDLDHEHADQVAAAIKQRELHSGAGRGPVTAADIPMQGATATDAVALGRMTRPAPENSAAVAAERITPGMTRRNIVQPAQTQAERNAELHSNAKAAGLQRSLKPVPSLADEIAARQQQAAAAAEGNK